MSNIEFDSKEFIAMMDDLTEPTMTEQEYRYYVRTTADTVLTKENSRLREVVGHSSIIAKDSISAPICYHRSGGRVSPGLVSGSKDEDSARDVFQRLAHEYLTEDVNQELQNRKNDSWIGATKSLEWLFEKISEEYEDIQKIYLNCEPRESQFEHILITVYAKDASYHERFPDSDKYLDKLISIGSNLKRPFAVKETNSEDLMSENAATITCEEYDDELEQRLFNIVTSRSI